MLNSLMVRGGAAVLVLATMGLCGSAEAQHRGSVEDQLACTPDVYRLCSNFVPDEDAITACLRRNLKALSPGCHQVFSRPDVAAPGANGDQDTD